MPTFKNIRGFPFAVFVFVFCLTAHHLGAQKIEKVEFKQGGGYTFPEESISYNVRSSKGRQFDQKIIDEDVKRLFSTGNFADVVAEKEQTSDGKVNVIFKLISKLRMQNLRTSRSKMPRQKSNLPGNKNVQ